MLLSVYIKFSDSFYLSEEESNHEIAHPIENVVPEGVSVRSVVEDQIEDVCELETDVV